MVTTSQQIHYPDSDGQPMADNTLQFEIIVTLKEGLEWLFREQPNVFVAGDLLWYPVQGDPKTRVAPDVMVAFGRPKGYRGSYKQWEEEGIPPQVVVEILSPGNSSREMQQKLGFYERHGVEEYYLHDPDRGTLQGYLRQGSTLVPIDTMQNWTSPRLGIRFELQGIELAVFYPDGEVFQKPSHERERANVQTQRANLQTQRANLQTQRADQAEQRAEREAARATQAAERAERLATHLRELGIDPDSL